MYRKTVVTFFLILTLFISPLQLLAAGSSTGGEKQQYKAEAMAVDAVLGRPIGVAATVTGFAFYLVSLPFSALGGNAGEAWDKLVVAPAEHTFARPLGEFEE